MEKAPSRKRTHSKSLDLFEGVKIVLLDIEGTTTPIDFVTIPGFRYMYILDEDKLQYSLQQNYSKPWIPTLRRKSTGTLFNYARDNLRSHLEACWDTDECRADVEALRKQAVQDADEKGVVSIPDADADKDALISAAEANVLWQMDNERKTTALKQLQGHIWREAFTSGKVQGRVYEDEVESSETVDNYRYLWVYEDELQSLKQWTTTDICGYYLPKLHFGKVYEDVVQCLKQWTAADLSVYIYSSGSVEAQKLLFANTEHGDLSAYISGYFDTKVGAKREKSSYQAIANEMSIKAKEVLFLSDIPAELSCAGDAGMKTCLVVREGNHPVTDEDKNKYPVVETFSELHIRDDSSPTKK